MMMFNLFFFMFISGVISFSINRKHLLVMLLSLEFIVLSVYLMMFFYLSMINNEYFFCMVFLTFTVCEGVLGLSLLVSMIRNYGNDYFQSFSVLW